MRDNGWSVDVMESKSFWNSKAQAWTQHGLKEGTPDVVGCSNEGIAVFIELKAPGRLSTLRESQRHFLEKKIMANSFAVVVDSIDRLSSLYNQWMVMRKELRLIDMRNFLLSYLPKNKNIEDQGNLFEEGEL